MIAVGAQFNFKSIALTEILTKNYLITIYYLYDDINQLFIISFKVGISILKASTSSYSISVYIQFELFYTDVDSRSNNLN
jgi:hypothetical protein